MKVYSEYDSIIDFKAWGGGAATLDQIDSVDKIAELDDIVEEMFPDGCSDTELNDWLWFDREYIYDLLGLDENGEIPEEDDEEEEEE